MYLNGVLLPISAQGYWGNNGYTPAYSFLTPFAIGAGSGFISGENTLDFIVFNNPDYTNNPPTDISNPTGLLVEMSGTATALPVTAPDAGSSAVLLAGALGVCAFAQRRQRRR